MIEKMVDLWTKFVKGEDLKPEGWPPLKKGMEDPKLMMALLDEHMLGMRVEGSEPEEVGKRFQFTQERMDEWIEFRGGLWNRKKKEEKKEKQPTKDEL